MLIIAKVVAILQCLLGHCHFPTVFPEMSADLSRERVKGYSVQSHFSKRVSLPSLYPIPIRVLGLLGVRLLLIGATGKGLLGLDRNRSLGSLAERQGHRFSALPK